MAKNNSLRKKGFSSDFFSLLHGKSLHVVLTLLVGVILARGLGPEGRGVLAGIMVYPMLLQGLLEGGLRQSAIYQIGKRTYPLEDILGSLFFGFVISSLIGGAGSYIAIALFVKTNISGVLIAAISIFISAQIGISYIKGVLLGMQEISSFSRTIWMPTFFLVITLIVIEFGPGLSVESSITATIVASLLGLFHAIWHLSRKVKLRFRVKVSVLWEMLRLGVVYAMALFSITLNYRIDVALLSFWSTSSEVGLYTVATNLGELIWFLPGIMVPLIFSRSANNDSTDHLRKFIMLVKFSIPISCICATILGVVGYFVIPIFYGPSFTHSSYSLILLLPGLTTMIIFKLLNADLAGRGEALLSLYSMIPAIALNIILNYFFIPLYGAAGAAFSSTISYIFCSLIFFLKYTKKRGVSFSQLFTYSHDDLLFVKKRIISLVG